MMMKQLGTTVLFLFLTMLLCAQDQPAAVPVEQKDLPAAVLAAFTEDHPGENGSWSKTGNDYRVEAVQKDSRVAYWIIYDSSGKVLKRDTEEESVPGERPGPSGNLRPASAGDTLRESRPGGPRSEALRYDSEGLPGKAENKPYAQEKQADLKEK